MLDAPSVVTESHVGGLQVDNAIFEEGTQMPPLPALTHWEETRTALHQSLQVLRSTRLLGVDPLPNSLEYGALPTTYGATTGPLNFGGELHLDFGRGFIDFKEGDTEVFTVALAGHNQTSLFDTVFAEFERAGHKLQPNRSKITNTTPFQLNPESGRVYAGVMWRMYTALARFRGRILGWVTPIMLWPHGFDLSFLWFPSGTEETKDPHVNFGFSPFTADVGQPYVYFYAYPVVAGLDKAVPSPMRWHTAWATPGGVLEYEKFAGTNDPEAMIEDLLSEVYRAALGKMG
jgi:hypothetical protein